MADPAVAPLRQLQVHERRALLMIGDGAAILLAVLLALVIWVIVDGRGQGIDFVLAHSYWFPILAGLWLLIASANDFYSLRVSSRLDTSFMRLVQVTLQMLVVYLVIFFFSPRGALPRLFILYYAALSFAFILAWRALHCRMTTGPGSRRRALIVGAGRAAAALLDVLRQEAPADYQIVGLVGEPDDGPGSEAGLPMITMPDDLLEIVGREHVSEIILAQERELSGQMFQAVMDCYERGLSLVPMPLLYEQITGRVPVEHVGQHGWATLLLVERESLFDPYPLLKRGTDILLALVGLAVFVPLLLLIAPVLRLDSPGPIFLRQERVGKGGKPIWMIKLRSMVADAEQSTGPVWAAANDPRVTRVGRLLRKTRLDEMPQLLNVLRGDMNLVGPRPERPEFVEELSKKIPFYRARHIVKPGITGWAQVHYPYGNSEQDALIKLQYDLYYIRHRSLALDLLIMLRTLGKMLSLQGR